MKFRAISAGGQFPAVNRLKFRLHPNYQKQRGAALIVAIMTMLILSGIALTLAKLSTSQNSIVDQAILRARTELALESAAHWITTATLQQDACISQANSQIFFEESGINVPNPIIGYHIRFFCDPNAVMIFDEGGVPVRRFGIAMQADYNEPTYNPNDSSFSGQRAMVVRRSVMEFSQ